MRFLQLYLSIKQTFDAADTYDEAAELFIAESIGGKDGTKYLWNKCASYERKNDYKKNHAFHDSGAASGRDFWNLEFWHICGSYDAADMRICGINRNYISVFDEKKESLPVTFRCFFMGF